MYPLKRKKKTQIRLNEIDGAWNSHLPVLMNQKLLDETLEIDLNMMNMFFLGPGEDWNVIQVYKDKEVVHVPEHIVNQDLEDGSSDG